VSAPGRERERQREARNQHRATSQRRSGEACRMNAVSATATRPEQAASAFPVRRDATTSVGVGFAEVLGPERVKRWRRRHIHFSPERRACSAQPRMVGRERRGGLVSVVNETSVSCAHRQADCGERGEQVQQTSLTAQSCPAHRPTSVVPLRGLGKPGRAITARPSPPPQSATAGENHPGEE